MKKIVYLLVLLAVVTGFESCNNADYTVVAPTFKGFSYYNIRSKEYLGEIEPGDSVKVTCVRKTEGRLVGQLQGNILLRVIYTYDDKSKETKDIESSVTSMVNSSLDGWKDPYAKFVVPASNSEKVLKNAEYRLGCTLSFKTFGTEGKSDVSGVNSGDEDPYIGMFNIISLTPSSGGKISTVPNGSFTQDPIIKTDENGNILYDEQGNVIIETPPVSTVDLTSIYSRSY